MWSEHRFLSFDGTPMVFRRLAAKQPRGVVLIVHGMGEHGGRYAEIGGYLAERGFTCYVPDLRGFGKSGGKRGCVRRFSDYFSDLESVRRAIASHDGSLGVFVLAHSYGGLVASHYLAAHPEPPFKGLVLSSPNFGIAIHVPVWRHLLGLVGSVLFPDLTQPNRVDRTKLTHDLSHLQGHANDPLIHDRISARLYMELVSRIRSSEGAASKIAVPALVLQAGEDHVVSREATEGFYKALSSPDKTLRIFDGLYHEILNETSRQTIFAQIADWLLQRG